MRVLIVKTSSLGDVVHMLPAVNDLITYYKTQSEDTLQLDWLVEEAFQEVPSWHPDVNETIPVAWRRWRQSIVKRETWQEMADLRKRLQAKHYDVVLDSQGLLKSALFSFFSGGLRSCGYDKRSAREALAASMYQQCFFVSRDLHAIERNRRLTALAFNYRYADGVHYGMQESCAASTLKAQGEALTMPYVLALHGTSRVDKEWPESAWLGLAKYLAQKGFVLVFPWGNSREHKRAHSLQQEADNIKILPRCSLQALLPIIRDARAVVGMDTGLMHIAAALGQSGIALYPVTEPNLTGVIGEGEVILEKFNKKRKIVSLFGKNTYNIKQVFELLSECLEKR